MSDTTHSPTALKIIATAKRLFMQRGYRAVSVNDIVQVAEITKPTLYYHFADKEQLFAEMGLHALEEMDEHMRAALEGQATTAGRLAAVAGLMTNAADGDTRMMRHEIREHLSPAQQARIGEAFQRHIVAPISAVMAEGVARGDLAPLPAEHLAWMFLSFVEGFHREPPDPERPGALAAAHFSSEQLIDLFLHGVAPRASR